jgi:hypothetical protein
MKSKIIQGLINHVAFVVDASSSMSSIAKDVVKIFDQQIEELKSSSRSLDQETRVSVYTFADTVNCLVFDMDCLRMPSLSEFEENPRTLRRPFFPFNCNN